MNKSKCVIVYRGDSFNNLVSARDYTDFELFCDWRIEKDSDSGLYLRGVPQVQIWDTLADAKNQAGSGGLFNNKKAESKPLVRRQIVKLRSTNGAKQYSVSGQTGV